MNRRKAIAGLIVIGGGTAATYSGLKWYELKKAPDIPYLENRRELVAALAEAIIPATDSPGAREAGVQDYIILMVRDCAEVKSQNRFIDGLKELEHHCQSAFGKNFQDCTEKQMREILKYFEEKGTRSRGILGKVREYLTGQSFFSILKWYTTEGYCTSEQGATRGLAYVPIPGKFQGCIPLKNGQKSWATK
jgi:hypothetical protein